MTKDEAFAKLAKGKFRSRFKLAADDLAYIERVGLEAIRRHAEDFVREKLGPAEPANDGKQTPMRNVPKNEVRREGREATAKPPARARGIRSSRLCTALRCAAVVAWRSGNAPKKA